DGGHETRQPARVRGLQARAYRPTLVAKLPTAVGGIREAGNQGEGRKESIARVRRCAGAFTLKSRRRVQVHHAPARPGAFHVRDHWPDGSRLSVDFPTPLPEGSAMPRRRGGESPPWRAGERSHCPAADAGGSRDVCASFEPPAA